MIHILLNGYKVVLASASPRRKLLLEMLGLKPLVIPSAVDEPVTKEKPHLQAMRHARRKAQAVATRMDNTSLVIGADTIVVVDGAILGKPANRAQATEYLRVLSGRSHNVYTGVALVKGQQVKCGFERSSVTFASMTDKEISDYVSTREPMDKAGAYGIQGFGSQFITGIRGCYFNVMGFPVRLFHDMLKELPL